MSALKIFQLKSTIFERPCDVTSWEKPVFHGVPAFAKTQEYQTFYFNKVDSNCNGALKRILLEEI